MGKSSVITKPSVLVVEDEAALRSVWLRTLSGLPYEVHAVADAESALPLISPDLSVVVCDVNLPGRSGLWLLDQIRSISPTTAVILATADPQVPATSRLEPAVVAYLVKPFALTELTAGDEMAIRWSSFRRTLT